LLTLSYSQRHRVNNLDGFDDLFFVQRTKRWAHCLTGALYRPNHDYYIRAHPYFREATHST